MALQEVSFVFNKTLGLNSADTNFLVATLPPPASSMNINLTAIHQQPSMTTPTKVNSMPSSERQIRYESALQQSMSHTVEEIQELEEQISELETDIAFLGPQHEDLVEDSTEDCDWDFIRLKYTIKNLVRETLANAADGQNPNLESQISELLEEFVQVQQSQQDVKDSASGMASKKAILIEKKAVWESKQVVLEDLTINLHTLQSAMEDPQTISAETRKTSCEDPSHSSRNSQPSHFKKIIRQKDNEIKKLQFQIDALKTGSAKRAAIKQAVKDAQEVCVEEEKAAITEAVQSVREIYRRTIGDLVIVGAELRNGELEKMKASGQMSTVIRARNQAAHGGRALADAMLYQSTCPKNLQRVDTQLYIKIYGVSPDLTCRFQDSQKFVDILDWTFDMKKSCTLGPYSNSIFGKQANAFLEKILCPRQLGGGSWDVPQLEEYFQTAGGSDFYQELKTIHIQTMQDGDRDRNANNQ